MKGAPQDIIGNDGTLETTGRAYFGDHIDDAHVAETQNHPLYRHLQRLNRIRRAIPALQKAPMSRIAEWGSGLSFVRDWNDGESYAVIGLAIGDGNLSFHVKGNSAGIYVLDGPGKIGEDGAYLR